VDAEGKQVAERLVEHGVLLPNGQGVQIQQIAQLVVLGDSDGVCALEREVTLYRPWVHNNVTLGWYMPAICLKKIDGLSNLDDRLLVGKYVR